MADEPGLLAVPPPTWRRIDAHGVGPFVTWVTYELPEGARLRWESRLHRKQHNRLDTGRGSTWWAPGAVAWWIGVLFMIGSVCFALGPLPAYADAVGGTADDLTFFVGSLFFTSAALLQYLETANALPPGPEPAVRGRVRFLTWEPDRIDWWACSVQLVGTLAFNVSTFSALGRNLDVAQVDRFVWRPDAVGSICFLVASGLAWAEVGHRWISWRPHVLSWWIALLNLAGSVAFGVSAVASYVTPAGDPRNLQAMNLGTFLGALGFLAGAFLLLPERTSSVPSVPSVPITES